MTLRSFGPLPDGTEIEEVTIAKGDLAVRILTIGAVIRDVRLAGIDHPLVLGFDRAADYAVNPAFFGAVAGRYANRIARGRFSIDGNPYQVSLNERGRQLLHGGFVGFSHRVWTLAGHDDSSVTLKLVSPDGEEGFPGKVEVTLRYSIDEGGVLRMDATGVTDAPTVLNLAQHSYFNLDDSPDILDHRIQIFADSYTPTDADLIPTGEVVSVAGSNFDLRFVTPIRRMRGAERVRYDTNFVVARRRSVSPRLLAQLTSPKNGVSVAVSSTEPGVQFYDGWAMAVTAPGLGGRHYGVNAGCALEPQIFPDAPNHAGFPSAILRPGETYRQVTTFAFARS